MSTSTTSIKAGVADFVGMDRETGRSLSGTAHLAQSIGDILSTRIGSRVERRDYGSKVPDYIDMPMTVVERTKMYGAAALALLTWDPRLKLARVQLLKDDAGTGMQGRHVFEVDLQVHSGAVTLEVPV
jgi:phage baseplate assembly protein W